MRHKILVIYNPASFKGQLLSKKYIRKAFLQAGLEVDVAISRKEGRAGKVAREHKDYDVLVAAGGDGTVNEIINGMNLKKQKLGILPVGTENVTARHFGIKLDIDEAIDVIRKGKTIKYDLGKANKRYFLLMAGVGFDASVVASVKVWIKRILGPWAFFFCALWKWMLWRPALIEVQVKGKKTKKGYYFAACNVKEYTRFLYVAKDARPDDGLLDGVLLTSNKRTDLWKFTWNCMKSKSRKSTDIAEYFKFRRCTVKSEGDVLSQVDGEEHTKIPLSISAKPKVLEMIVPNDFR